MADIIDFAFYKQFGVILFAHRASFLKKKNKKTAIKHKKVIRKTENINNDSYSRKTSKSIKSGVGKEMKKSLKANSGIV